MASMMETATVSAAAIEVEAQGTADVVFEVFGEVFWLAVGFALIHYMSTLGWIPHFSFLSLTAPPKGKSKSKSSTSESGRRLNLKRLSAASAVGQTAEALAAWDAEKAMSAVPLEALKDAAQALAEIAPERLVSDLIDHLAGSWAAAQVQASTMNALVEVVALSGRQGLASELADGMQARFNLKPTSRTQEILATSVAATSGAKKAVEAEREGPPCACGPQAAAVRAHATAARAMLRARRPIAAMHRFGEMQDEGLEVPPRAFGELLEAAQLGGRSTLAEVVKGLGAFPKVPMDAFVAPLMECVRSDDVQGAKMLEALAAKQDAPMPFAVMEALLKLYAKADTDRAATLFEDLQVRGFYASEGLCGSLMARSGEARHVAFAEKVADYLRGRSMMTLATFKTLMKVYATNGFYEKACDLYEEITAAGVEPDQVMYGCLAKFAARCNRLDLAQQLQSRRSGTDLQSYIYGIRSAARDGDVERALGLLRQAEASQESTPDVAVYNCAVDACVTAGRMDRATELMQEMSRRGLANKVTYNTRIKGCCASGDRAAARQVLSDMSEAGVAPDSASYNSLLSAAVECGSLNETWGILREMERDGIAMDHYTVSIMMKVAKKARSPQDASRALAVLDRATGVSACDDEVLLNTVLDACIGRKDLQRLAVVTGEFGRDPSRIRPSVHTYGLLVKAFGMLKDVERCRSLWTEMVERREIVPSTITLSCMLDALCVAGKVEEAVSLLKEWKGRVPTNTVMYSTLIKGFTAVGDADRAMDMHRDLRAEGLHMNLVAYTSLIDAHVRAGRMDRATATFQQMKDDGCQPNVITYSTLAKGYCLRGDMDEAMRLFKAMLNSGLSADTVIFNTLLDGCMKHSRFEIADTLLEDMAGCGVEPSSYTLSIIVKLWGKRRHLDKAFETVRAHRGQVDTQVAACLITTCFHNRDGDRAVKAFEEVQSLPGCKDLDAHVYGALVAGFVRVGDLHRAVDFATQACEASIVRRSSGKLLGAECIASLFKALQTEGLDGELGAPLAQKLRLARMAVPDATERDSARLEPAWRRTSVHYKQRRSDGGR